ncbi:unnamed protein product [Rhizophagus irregularis]|nr:unnamed protein product [Rhizophagus irregularis]
MPYLVSSRPLSYDSLWKYVEKEGFGVETFDRDHQNHEKEVDSEIACAMIQTSLLNEPEPGTIVLISGDKDMCPGKKRLKWRMEYRDLVVITNILLMDMDQDELYRMKFFDITNGNVFDNNDVLDWFARINLFCWMSRRGNNLRLYFKNDNDLSNAKEWIRTHQNNVRFRR